MADALPTAARDGRWEGEGALLATDGTEIPVWMSIVAHPALTPGTAPHFSAVMRDLRPERAARAALETERAFLAQVLDSLTENVSVCAPDGRLVLFNRATLETHGLPVDSPLPPEQWGGHYKVYQPDGVTEMPTEALPHVRVLASRAPVDGIEFVVRATGREPRTMVANAQPMHGRDGAFLGSVCAVRDMTAHKAAERALRDSEAQLQAALEGGRFGYLALRPARDAEGNIVDLDIVDANVHAATLLGTPLDELLEQRIGELYPTARATGALPRIIDVLHTGQAAEYEQKPVDPRIAARWVRYHVAPVLGLAGTPEGVTLMMRDISAEVQAREELRVLVDVTAALTQASDAAAATGAALRVMCEAVGFEYGEAWLMAPGADGRSTLRHGPVWHAADDERLAEFVRGSRGIAFGRGEGLAGAAWAAGAPVVARALPGASLCAPRLPAIRRAALRAGRRGAGAGRAVRSWPC